MFILKYKPVFDSKPIFLSLCIACHLGCLSFESSHLSFILVFQYGWVLYYIWISASGNWDDFLFQLSPCITTFDPILTPPESV
jgi:hypothetical protein